MKTILYTTDYSKNSIPALHFAYGISQKMNAKMVALHVFDIPLVMGSTTSLTYARKEVKAIVLDKEKLASFCKEYLGNDPEKLNIAIKIMEETPISQGILKKAEEIEADLIVLGTKGNKPIGNYLLGSTTTTLIEKADCPILAIPPNTPFKAIDKIVYASDFEGSDIFAIEDLIELAKPFDAEIYLVHITSKDNKTSADQMEWFKNMLHHKVHYENIHFETRFGVDVFKTLEKYVNEINPEIVAMLQREGHNLIKNLWHRNLVKRMKNEAHYPLLSFNKRNVAI
tara:strand:- start:904 stop:1755 length:852 start_codon:yes stop_codon:yes gene_type:complete